MVENLTPDKRFLTLPPNFVLLTKRIPVSWLIQIRGGGHGLMYKYPDALSQSALLFLSLTGEGWWSKDAGIRNSLLDPCDPFSIFIF